MLTESEILAYTTDIPADIQRLKSEPPVRISDGLSGGDSEWITYLKETGEYNSYDGMCECYRCRDIAKGFERWKHEKEHGPTKYPAR